MSLTLNVMRKPIGTINFDIETDFNQDITLVSFWNDEKLLDLMREIGKKEDVFISFTKMAFEQLIFCSQQIDDGAFFEEKTYKYRYANETMLDFYTRWDAIIKGLKNTLFRLDWEEEHVVVYVSC